jgi:non-specific serine/threonine protein kinase
LHLPRIQYERGMTLLATEDVDRAHACFGRAAAGCERIGLPELATRIAAAQRPADKRPGAASASERVELRREGELWVLSRAEESHRLRDSRGMQILARLVEMAEREVHVLDLVRDSEGPVDMGDAGELIDAQARDAYRRRLTELRAELADADGANDLGRSERARLELEQIEAELAGALGLGGRRRRAPNATERARSNAQRRIAEALRRIHEASPTIGGHLERCVRTGIYCRYSPMNPRR